MLTASFNNTFGTLAAATAAQIAPAPNTVCSQLIVSNAGSNGMVIKFGAAPSNGTDGTPIAPGSVLTLSAEELSQTDPVFGLSTAGTSYHCAQGVGVVART